MFNNVFVKIVFMRKRKLYLDDLEEEYYFYMNMIDILYIIYLIFFFLKSRGY